MKNDENSYNNLNNKYDSSLSKDTSMQLKKPISKHELVREAILQNIEKGNYRPGDKLPSEGELCSEYQTSRITVRRALNDLLLKDILYTVQGVGSFVKKTETVLQQKVIFVIPSLFHSIVDPMIHNYVHDYAEGMTQVFSQHNITLLEVLEPNNEKDIPSFITILQGMKPFGVIYMTYHNFKTQDKLMSLECPIVFLDIEPEENMFDAVVGSDYISAYLATQLMIGEGRRNIGFFAGAPRKLSTCHNRLQGVIDAVKSSDCIYREEYFYTNESTPEIVTEERILQLDTTSEVRNYLEKNRGLDGLIVFNDSTANLILLVARELNIRIPQDIALISYGNYFDKYNSFSDKDRQYQVTSFEQNFSDYGKEAAELVCKRAKNELPNMQQKRTVSYNLIRRKTF